MKRSASEYKYPLRLPVEEGDALAKAVKETGQSINSLITLCVRKGLPLVQESLARESGRVVLADPFPESVLRKAYAFKDEIDGVTARQLASFQSKKEPESNPGKFGCAPFPGETIPPSSFQTRFGLN